MDNTLFIDNTIAIKTTIRTSDHGSTARTSLFFKISANT